MTSVISNPNHSVLLVKIPESLAQQASVDLNYAGFTTAVAIDFNLAKEKYKQIQPGMVIIDYDLAGESGLKFCRDLRNDGNRNPILLLVEQAIIDFRVNCLEAGADDYLIKPYNSQQFLNFIKLYLQPKTESKQYLSFLDLILDLNTRRLIRNDRGIDLTMKEFELLKYLMSHPQEVLSREQILENVWGYDFTGESNVIEVYIRYLRLKLESEGQKRLIQTVRGVGYVLRDS